VVQELRVRYQRSVLGFFWTLLNPLLMMLTLAWVFSSLEGFREIEHYTLYLFAGMVPWGFMSGCVGESALCIVVNENLIRKIYVPKLVFPVSRLFIHLVTFLLSLVPLFALLLPLGARPSWAMLALPLGILLYAVFTLGLSLAIATANTFFRDCGHLVTVFMQAWYFATPILYPASGFPVESRWRFRVNPAYYFIELFHDILFAGQFPQIGSLLVASAIAAVSLGIGYAIFKSQEDKMVFRL
jgi:ABC-2 type transport system permease protein/lipopolysaccharide transport system permease protein